MYSIDVHGWLLTSIDTAKRVFYRKLCSEYQFQHKNIGARYDAMVSAGPTGFAMAGPLLHSENG